MKEEEKRKQENEEKRKEGKDEEKRKEGKDFFQKKKNVSEPSNPPEELTQNVSKKKNPRRTNYSSIFSAKVQNLTVFHLFT